VTDSVPRPKIGVMGSANSELVDGENSSLVDLARRLGEAIADRNCVLITGATTGLPDLVSRAARRRNGLTVGISPGANREEQVERYSLPADGADVIIYTGFGLKGRNVVNIRSSDIVIIFGGDMGALNEFTIAYDEGKVIGVVEGSGGMADRIKGIVESSRKSTTSRLIYSPDPESLIDLCLQAFNLAG
jgi:uncharacterized protein (TIGR00725 family)